MRICPKCAGELRNDGYCERCKITFKVYERIKTASKVLYNKGLQLAEMRDLSNAVHYLQRSVKMDKTNIDARNLLGLVFFEMGETVLALQQWVISKSLKPSNNVAEKYLKIIQENQSHLEKLSNAIRYYNQALNHLNQGSEDLAIIQLKKVVSLNQNFIKGYTLLALCYMKSGQNQKALKILQKVLNIDKQNLQALKYYQYLVGDDAPASINDQEDDVIPEVIPTPSRMSGFMASSFQQVLFVAGGALLGLAVALFMIMPARIEKKDLENKSLKEQVASNQEKITQLSQDLQILAAENENLKIENEDYQEDIKQVSTTNTEMSKMLVALQHYGAKDYVSTANALYFIDSTALAGTELATVYDTLTNEVYAIVAKDAYNLGYNYYSKWTTEYWQKAIEQFSLSIRYVQDADYTDDAYYYRALTYIQLGNTQEAIKDLEMIVNNYPNSNRKAQAQQKLNQL